MTEEEAKTMWCPAARVDCTAANRPNPGPNCDTTAGWPPCIGSAYMAFREAEPEFGEVLESQPAGPDTSLPGPEWGYLAATNSWVRRAQIRHFYCGLAGKP